MESLKLKNIIVQMSMHKFMDILTILNIHCQIMSI